MGSVDSIDPYLTPLPRGSLRPTEGDVPLKVGIVGAGIAGLACAIALLENGHDVERSRFANEIGAGIHITPNSSRVLEYYGFDAAAANAGELNEMAFINPTEGTVANTMQYPDSRKTFGAPWYFFHRVDLHNGLMQLATKPKDASISPAKLHLQTNVTDVHPDGTISFDDGRSVQKDLVVVANGIHSAFADKVAGMKVVNDSTGLAMMRFIIPMSRIMEDKGGADLYTGSAHRFLHAQMKERIFVSYPCRGGSMANCCFFHKDEYDWSENTSSIPAKKEDLLRISDGFASNIRGVAEKAEDLSVWHLQHRRKPVQQLVNNRLVIVGDTAHPMLPFLGQGGAMAVEDASVMGVLMSSIKSASEVPERLKLYNDTRSDRSCAMQILSNWAMDGLDTCLEQAKPYMTAIKKIPETRAELNEWNFRINVQRDALELLQEYQAKQKH